MKAGWATKTIADVCSVVNGGTPKTGVSDYWDGAHQWITPAEMGKRSTPYIAKTERTITDAGMQNSSARLLPPLSVILSSRAPIGHLVINTEPMATNQGCKGLVPSDELDHKYLYYYLSSIVQLLNDLGTGATFKELSGGKLKEVPIPVPPLPEQQRIVAILDEAFAGIATARAAAEQNRQNAGALFQSGYIEVFQQVVANGYRPTTVAEVAYPSKGSVRTGPFGSQLLHSEFVDHGVAVLGIDNAVKNEFRWDKRRYITQEKYSELSRYRVKPGDVIITIMGTCGRCAIVPDDIPLAINTKHLCCITLDPSKCIPEFLHGYFLYHPVAQKFLTAQAKGSIMAGLNIGIISALPILLPSLAQQQEIAHKVGDLKEEAQRLEALYLSKLEALDELKQSLLHQAFSGQL